jgi:hypothetical protein
VDKILRRHRTHVVGCGLSRDKPLPDTLFAEVRDVVLGPTEKVECFRRGTSILGR